MDEKILNTFPDLARTHEWKKVYAYDQEWGVLYFCKICNYRILYKEKDGKIITHTHTNKWLEKSNHFPSCSECRMNQALE